MDCDNDPDQHPDTGIFVRFFFTIALTILEVLGLGGQMYSLSAPV